MSGTVYSGVTWVSSTGTRMSSTPFRLCPTFRKTNSQLQSEGYSGSTGKLVAAHDAATAHLSVPWRMPTSTDLFWLEENCDTTWTTRNGVYGLLVKGRGTYSSKSIFLPAAGYGFGDGLHDVGSYGRYWCSTPYSSDDSYYATEAWGLYFGSAGFYRSRDNRSRGYTVRPVRSFAK